MIAHTPGKPQVERILSLIYNGGCPIYGSDPHSSIIDMCGFHLQMLTSKGVSRERIGDGKLRFLNHPDIS
jgi:hypothetical protein